MDDIVGFFQSKTECEEFASFLNEELKELGMTVGMVDATDSKTKIYMPRSPAEFLGMDIAWSGSEYHLQISEKCLQKITAKMAQASDLDFVTEEVNSPSTWLLFRCS